MATPKWKNSFSEMCKCDPSNTFNDAGTFLLLIRIQKKEKKKKDTEKRVKRARATFSPFK